MDIKILIACLVFFLIWRITISQQVSESKDQMKIYHANHIDEMKKQSSLTNHQNGRIKKYIELGPPALGPITSLNKNINPEKRTKLKVIRIKPTAPNLRKPFKFVVKNQDGLNLTDDGLNEANVTNYEQKEDKTTNDLKDFSVMTDESTARKEMDPELGTKLKGKLKKIIPYNSTSPNKPAFFIDFPTSQNVYTTKSKFTKPLVIEQKLQQDEFKQDDVQIDTSFITDEAISDETEDTNSEQAKLYPIVNDNDKEKPKKHPFLDAIQNDRYLMCSLQDAPNASVIADTSSIEDIELQFRDDRLSGSPKVTPDPVHMIIPHIDTKDEDEDVTIKNSAYEEISEISNLPKVTQDSKLITNNIPVPYKYNQVLKSIDIHNELDPRTPDEQEIEEKDQRNVFIHNSYYLRPNPYWYGFNYQHPYKQNYQDLYYSNYQPTAYNAKYGNNVPRAYPEIQNYWNKMRGLNRDVNRNRITYYGYNSVQPQQMQNYWHRDYDSTRGINEIIHRKWTNTEYNIKGNNTLKRFSDDVNFRNRYVQRSPTQNIGGLNNFF